MDYESNELVIESFMKSLMKDFPEFNWENDDKINFTLEKKSIGSIVLNNTRMTTDGNELIKALNILIKKKEEIDKKQLTEERLNKSIFKNSFSNKNRLNGLCENPEVFESIENKFKRAGISSILVNTRIDRGNFIAENLTIFIDSPVAEQIRKSPPPGFYTRLKNYLFDKLENDATAVDDFRAIFTDYWIAPLSSETPEEIKIENILVGHYFRERNIIHLFFNPFMCKKILPLSTDLPKTIVETLLALKDLKIKETNTFELRKKIFVEAFLEGSKQRLEEISRRKNDVEQSINTYEKGITDNLSDLNSIQDEEMYIKKNIELSGKGLYEEIEKIKNLNFVQNVETGNDFVKIKFQDASIKVNDFIRTDHGKGFGKRTLYLGPIEVTIKPGVFIINNAFPIDGSHPHPHASGVPNGSPCFGSGEGRNKIYEMLASNKFTELTKLLWFWIKTYRNDGAYIKMWDFYDRRLSNGFPVWDENGNRIELNDKDRINSGEQITLTKGDKYDENIKKFKDIKYI